MLLLDSREPASFYAELQDIAQVEALSSGDARWFAITSELVGLERKSVTDFLNSLSNGSLADELRRLRDDCDLAILLYEGPITVNPITGVIYRTYWSGGKFKKVETGWHLNNYVPAIYGFCRSLGIIPFYSPSVKETAKVLRYLYNYDQEKYHAEALKARHYTYVVPSPAAVMLSAVVGPKTADSLLTHFGTLRKVITAEPKELMVVDGIGPKTAEKVYRILDTPYVKSGFDFSQMV